jgi:gas vesicle protein
MKKGVSNFMLGFLAGAAAGALAGVLLAPDKGSETRKNLRKKVRDLSDEYGLGLSEMMDNMEPEPVKSRGGRKGTGNKEKGIGKGNRE